MLMLPIVSAAVAKTAVLPAKHRRAVFERDSTGRCPRRCRNRCREGNALPGRQLGLSEEATAVVVKPLMVNVAVAVVAEPLPLVNTAR